ncbi:MAG: isoprenylcysteine carboxylmethyltransferase family protein [Chloroflexi bacterium]|nr:MAG: isoprenylcysteine carboxylmethyltransferase family protein [Chloroflexota bacterium]
MDPELYVFQWIERPALKVAASTALFILLTAAARLLLPGSRLGLGAQSLTGWLAVLVGFVVFIYASYQAWRATREKNAVEDPKRQAATRLLDTGFYARVRHPMYGMFILANAGLGLAAGSIYGLAFGLLSVVVFVLNGFFEERALLIPQFGGLYRDYMRRVPARFFTPLDAALLAVTLALSAAGVWLM